MHSSPYCLKTHAFPFTVSIGVTETSEGERDLDAILERADRALYRTKNAGRNRVVRWSR